MKALAFGEVLWDIYPENQYIGGAPFNFAAHFKKCGGEPHIITAVVYDNCVSCDFWKSYFQCACYFAYGCYI